MSIFTEGLCQTIETLLSLAESRMHRNVHVRFGGGTTANPFGRTCPTQHSDKAFL